ncbi:MAG TPA: T9SS type A sorting domain-containing protein [Bacteroidia bacterium]|nr:T9SS type A sorting domain-containing protein [Bacteroidia bacterium]
MKSKLLKLTVAAFVAMTTFVHAQTTAPATLGAAIVTETFENWSGASPNVPANWEVAPANTIAAANVQQVTTSTVTPVQSGTYSCKLINTASSYTSGILAGTPVSVTAGMGYQISYYARGKGTINVEVTDGSAASTFTNYATANGQTVSGKAWHHYFQTVTAATTTNNAQFCLKVKSTSTYTASGGVSITGIDVDSFVVQPYTLTPNASLADLEYTTAANGNSRFFGQSVVKTGGIVTAQILGSTGPSGYYVQTTGSTAWGAALVFDQTNAPNVSVGDSVTFGCAVDEYFNMTELVSVTNFVNVSSGNPVTALTNSANGVNSQTLAQEQYEGFRVGIENATVNTYSANYGQGTITDATSGVPCTFDAKTGFYAPHGSATSGSSGNPGYVLTVGTTYCMYGNINYEFSAYNIVPRDSGDIMKNCTVLGIAKHSSLNANVYPNPMANELNIQLPFEATKVSVSITDIMGREMITPIATSGANVNVNNVNLNAGTYFVKITADGKTQITKVVKQ